jgi:hypothetical protein
VPTLYAASSIPSVELVRSTDRATTYHAGVIGWTQFHSSTDPYNQIDTHINALIAIRARIQRDEAQKAAAEAQIRKEREQVRNARVCEILVEAGFSTANVSNDPARRLAEKIFEMEQEAKK